jgi:hypothetical protein
MRAERIQAEGKVRAYVERQLAPFKHESGWFFDREEIRQVLTQEEENE